MSPVRKTLTEISNSSSFASSDASYLQVNGRSFQTPKGGGVTQLRSRSPSPSLNSTLSSISTGSTATNASNRELQGYVGFANIPNQLHRKAVKQGFELTLMVVGASGLGKSTFMNSLFLAQIYGSGGEQTVEPTTRVEEQRLALEENGVRLSLTLVDTPGFGDQLDNSRCWEPILQYVDRKFSDYFTEETNINRAQSIPDERVHACLYFIEPTGHGLKPLDIEFMKRLSQRINVIPVIAKADCLTVEEMAGFKQRVARDIAKAEINVYKPEEEDKAGKKAANLPFAVVGSTSVTEEGGRRIRCRRYPWGVVEVDNLEHNDFVALRNMLIRTQLMDLVEMTNNCHYENFRCRQLGHSSAQSPRFSPDIDPFTAMAEQKKHHQTALQQKQQDMERVFREKVAFPSPSAESREEEGWAVQAEEKEAKLRALETAEERALAEETAEVRRLEAALVSARQGLEEARRLHPSSSASRLSPE